MSMLRRIKPREPLQRYLIDPVQAFAIYVGYGFVALLPVAWASALFGRLVRWIGPHTRMSDRARRNLVRAYPDMPRAEIEAIVAGMFENFGRMAGEYPGLRRFWDDSIERQVAAIGAENIRNAKPADRPVVIKGKYIELVGVENFLEMRDDGRPALLFSAHFGNWELMPLGAERFGLHISSVFRFPNNPHVTRLLFYFRRGMGTLLPKGIEGALMASRVLDQGGHLAMLVDQKLNRGIAIPFFGRPAMTAPALAKLAYRYRCPVYGARVERLGGTRFRMTIDPPLKLPRFKDERRFVEALMTEVNAVIEGWVRARPDQWLWVHRRWPD